MDERTKKQLIAYGKIGIGVGRMISGVVTASGHGLLGSYLRNRNMQQQALWLGKKSVEAGKRMTEEAVEELKRLR